MKSWEQHLIEGEKALKNAEEAKMRHLEESQTYALTAIAHFLAANVGVTAANSVSDIRRAYENLQMGLVTKKVDEEGESSEDVVPFKEESSE